METDVDPKQEAANLDDVREKDLISAGEVTDTTPAKANEESIEEAEAPTFSTVAYYTDGRKYEKNVYDNWLPRNLTCFHETRKTF